MSQISQKEAVYAAVLDVLGDTFVSNSPLKLTKEQRIAIQNKVTAALTTGNVAFRNPEKLKNAEYVKTYVIGLVSNWVRRDPRFKAAVAAAVSSASSANSSPTASTSSSDTDSSDEDDETDELMEAFED